MDRREFLAAGTAPVVVAASVGASSLDAEAPAASRATRQQEQTSARIGLIGAGSNVQAVQIPGFRRITDVEIVAVANRSLASSQRVAEAFGIPRAYAHWGELLEDDDVDAVLIGTWPYMHRTLTVAALEAGKHVLCQARMANDAAEAHEMLDASQRHPELVCQLVPTSTSYEIDNVLKGMIDEGFLGDVLSVEIQRCSRRFAELDGDLDWRHDRRFSGYNTLNMGSTYESMMRWLGRGNRVMAMAKVHVPFRAASDGRLHSVSIPDHVDVMYELANGGQVHMRFSETTGLSSGNQTWIFGTDATVHVDGTTVRAGRRGDSELTPVPNPVDGQAFYRVEEEFINAIRGLEEVSMLTFEAGSHYMEWTEAVHRSARSGETVYLPL